MTHDFACRYEKIRAFAEKFLADGGLSPVISKKYIIVPGLCDVHVHFREPGFSYKETIASGSAAAAHGGYTAVCTMPNLDPVPDSAEHLQVQLDAIKRGAAIKVLPYGAITVGEKGERLADMEAISDKVCAFSDDGKGVQNDEMMREAMTAAKRLGKIIAAHCEDNSLLFGGYIHDGEYARMHGHRGISSASEYRQIERDLRLAEETGCAYHVCHISTKESVELIRQAKARGVDVTCETAPHYLVLCDEGMQEDGRFKMNPPLRSREDKQALIEGIKDGTIDMIATDHAPHSAEEKGRGLEKSLMGVVGLETAFPVLYTELVMKNIITLDRLVELMSFKPKERFGIDTNNDFAVFDISEAYKIDPEDFLSMGRATPFAGREVFGRCLLTVHNGKVVYKAEDRA
ncbi:MAG: dihydroorotase [Oscillospiraceae bacterium]|nr:dihydroorotase [Oscillospiraceae bacterium]MDD6982435.1 dihydroorotase [Oscillospiraceae bacterium]MDY4623140.1 dihydroorotase [Oscillospiraceae bacterium]